jgi:hypothetical protein
VTPLLPLIAAALADPMLPPETPAPVERVLIYWMAYDNDLSVLADDILGMIEEGVQSPQVVVTVHVDRRGPGGMERIVITDQGRTRTPLPDEEGSAELGLLVRELDRVASEHPAARYGVVFLDHGGRLDEMSHDEHGGSPWLDPRHVGPALTSWDARHPGELDLVFLQQCGKANLETLHAFAGSADAVVASEAVIGAPNFYYPQALQTLSADPTLAGPALAKALVQHDRPDMYRSYTVASGQALLELPERLAPVIAPLLALGADLRWNGGPEPAWEYAGERYPDLFGLLGLLYAENDLDPAPTQALRTWWDADALLTHQVSPDHPRDGRRLSGATVLLPDAPGGWRSYGDFPLYQQSDLPLLLDQLLR